MTENNTPSADTAQPNEKETVDFIEGGLLPEPLLEDAPTPGSPYITKEAHFNENCLILEAKIEVHEKLNFALEIKIGRFAEQYGETEWADVPYKDLKNWAKLQIRHFDNDATLSTARFDLNEIRKNLNTHLKRIEIYEKQMVTGWDECIEKLKEQIQAKRRKNQPTLEESNTLTRANEAFLDREEKVEFFRAMLSVLGIK